MPPSPSFTHHYATHLYLLLILLLYNIISITRVTAVGENAALYGTATTAALTVQAQPVVQAVQAVQAQPVVQTVQAVPAYQTAKTQQYAVAAQPVAAIQTQAVAVAQPVAQTVAVAQPIIQTVAVAQPVQTKSYTVTQPVTTAAAVAVQPAGGVTSASYGGFGKSDALSTNDKAAVNQHVAQCIKSSWD